MSGTSPRALIEGLGLGFVGDPGPLHWTLYRLRTVGQALVLAECPPRWRPTIELALALSLAPDRSVGVVHTSDEDWEALLDGQMRQRPPSRVWVARGLDGEAFEAGIQALNFRRDQVVRPGMCLWVWLPAGGLGRVPSLAPDLWPYHSATLELRPSLALELDLPTPVPPLPWPWSWKRERLVYSSDSEARELGATHWSLVRPQEPGRMPLAVLLASMGKGECPRCGRVGRIWQPIDPEGGAEPACEACQAEARWAKPEPLPCPFPTHEALRRVEAAEPGAGS